MPDSTKSTTPGRKPTCMEMLQLMLDGDATPEQQQEFKSHLDECMPCYQSYNLELTLKTLIRTKCNGNGAKQELIEKIKNQISQNPSH